MISACNRKMLLQFRYMIEIFHWLYLFGQFTFRQKSDRFVLSNKNHIIRQLFCKA